MTPLLKALNDYTSIFIEDMLKSPERHFSKDTDGQSHNHFLDTTFFYGL